MDLVNAAIQCKQASVTAKVQYAVAGKILDQQRSDGAAAVKLIDAANIGVNRTGDALAVAATGLGGSLDLRA